MTSGRNQPTQLLLMLDDHVLAQTIVLALNHGAFLTDIASGPTEAIASLKRHRPHIAILDMDVVDGELMALLGYPAGEVPHVPVIALTRRGDLKTKLAAFDWGVDDVVSIPFSPEELLARALALLRRTFDRPISFTPVLKIGELEIDIVARTVRVGESELHLTSLQHSLLYLLAANAGRLLTRDQILDYLWGADYVAESNVVDRHIRDLRAQLQNSWKRPRYIATIPGKGYRFVPATEQPATG